MSKAIVLETTSLSVTTASLELLAPQPMRSFLFLQNEGANDIYVRFGTTAAVADTTSHKIAASGGTLTVHTPGTGAIQAIAVTAATVLTITTNADPHV